MFKLYFYCGRSIILLVRYIPGKILGKFLQNSWKNFWKIFRFWKIFWKIMWHEKLFGKLYAEIFGKFYAVPLYTYNNPVHFSENLGKCFTLNAAVPKILTKLSQKKRSSAYQPNFLSHKYAEHLIGTLSPCETSIVNLPAEFEPLTVA